MVVVTMIVCLSSCLLVACALQDPLAVSEQVRDSRLASIPVTARLGVDAPAEYGFFGGSVAIDGDTAVVGAWGESDTGRNMGAAYVFDRVGHAWTQRARLTASDAAAGARFGHSVAISGTTIFVGAVYHAGNGPRAGAVYVFELADDAWHETALLTPSEPVDDAYFGSAVALHDRWGLIGASGPNGGAAYVFSPSERGWIERARLTPVDFGAEPRFAASLDIDGDTAIVGAPAAGTADDEGVDEPGHGSAYLFEFVDGTWQVAAVLTAGADSAERQFGHSVAVRGDTAAVGAPGSDEAVFVYRRADSSWALEREIHGPSVDAEHFGVSVALEEDLLVVGAPGSDDRSGAAYLFERVADAWLGTARAVVSDPDPSLQLGGAVAIDAGTAVIGATGGRSAGVASGAAFAVH